jgi:hypothetical protein
LALACFGLAWLLLWLGLGFVSIGQPAKPKEFACLALAIVLAIVLAMPLCWVLCGGPHGLRV